MLIPGDVLHIQFLGLSLRKLCKWEVIDDLRIFQKSASIHLTFKVALVYLSKVIFTSILF